MVDGSPGFFWNMIFAYFSLVFCFLSMDSIPLPSFPRRRSPRSGDKAGTLVDFVAAQMERAHSGELRRAFAAGGAVMSSQPAQASQPSQPSQPSQSSFIVIHSFHHPQRLHSRPLTLTLRGVFELLKAAARRKAAHLADEHFLGLRNTAASGLRSGLNTSVERHNRNV